MHVPFRANTAAKVLNVQKWYLNDNNQLGAKRGDGDHEISVQSASSATVSLADYQDILEESRLSAAQSSYFVIFGAISIKSFCDLIASIEN